MVRAGPDFFSGVAAVATGISTAFAAALAAGSAFASAAGALLQEKRPNGARQHSARRTLRVMVGSLSYEDPTDRTFSSPFRVFFRPASMRARTAGPKHGGNTALGPSLRFRGNQQEGRKAGRFLFLGWRRERLFKTGTSRARWQSRV